MIPITPQEVDEVQEESRRILEARGPDLGTPEHWFVRLLRESKSVIRRRNLTESRRRDV